MIRMIHVCYLSEKVVVFCGNKMFSFQNVTFELKYIKTDTSVSRQNTQKFSQSQSRSESESESESQSRGPCPRRLTQALEPPSQCPMGVDRSHTAPDDVRAGGWCACARDARQAADRACFSSSSGSNPRSTSYARMLKQSRARART